jgi:hypothetical protein
MTRTRALIAVFAVAIVLFVGAVAFGTTRNTARLGHPHPHGANVIPKVGAIR